MDTFVSVGTASSASALRSLNAIPMPSGIDSSDVSPTIMPTLKLWLGLPSSKI